MGGLDWVFNFVADEFLVVALPRRLVLSNRRLGMLYKTLQGVFILLAAAYAVYSGIFFQQNYVKEWGVNLWHVQNPAQAAATGAPVGPQCENPAVYAHKGDPMFSYAPTSCKELSNEEPIHMESSKLFVPTFVDEEIVWDKCGANVSQVCKGYSSEAVYTESKSGCTCTRNEQFLVQNAEEQRIRFVYGYEADASDGRRSDLRRGGIVSSMASKGASHEMKDYKTELETHFVSPDGSDCSFGGRSLWQHSDSVGGITGTLNELLACAGVTLDTDPESLVAGTFVAPPHLRTMGFKLQLHLHIHETAFFEVKCEVRVVATPVTTAMWDKNARPFVIPEIGASTHRTQRIHGVDIDVQMTGSVKTFSWNQVVRGFVDITVVLTVPSMIIQFVAMYLMGLVSEVYRHSARTKLNIFGKFHNTMAKLMLAEVAFRGLVGKWDGRTRDLGSLDPNMLLQRLEDIFEEVTNTGLLRQEELKKMAAVVFTSMDKDGNGAIGCSEFVQTCTNDGEITLRRMAHFFGGQGSKSCMRRLFDNTDTVVTSVASRSMTNLSFMDTTTPEKTSSSDASAVSVFDRSGWDDSDSMSNTEKLPVRCGEKKDVPPSIVASRDRKDIPPRILAAGDIDILAAHESTLARLEERIQELELHCAKAVDVLRMNAEPRASADFSIPGEPQMLG